MRLEAYRVRNIVRLPAGGLLGRRKILTKFQNVNRDNVVEFLQRSLAVHSQNSAEITYLYNYYKGCQDIRSKVKFYRTEINNKVTVNKANEIVTFKTSYLLAEPIQYIAHDGDEKISENVKKLNEFMRKEDKESKDKELVDWIHICGVGTRMALPDPEDDEEGSPFNIYTVDPRDGYVAYSARLGNKPVAAVLIETDENENSLYTVYTPDPACYVVHYDGTIEEKPNYVGIPMVEYVNNEARMGAFEPVLSILNNINQIESDAVDSIQDFVNGFDVFQNCEVDDGTYSELTIGGKAIKVKTITPGMEAKVYRIYSEISQSGVQTRIDDLSKAYLEICGMPNRNGGLSTSDTGSAVIYRDGFVAAHARAVDTATLFKRSEREFDRIVLKICKSKQAIDLKIADFEAKFPLGNLTNLQSLVQIFIQLLNQPEVHPKVAYEVGSALFKDPENAYRMGKEWYESNNANQEKKLNGGVNAERTRALRSFGSDNPESELVSVEKAPTNEAAATG